MLNKSGICNLPWEDNLIFLVLGLGQIVATLLILRVAKLFKIVNFPDLTKDTARKVRKCFNKDGWFIILCQIILKFFC